MKRCNLEARNLLWQFTAARIDMPQRQNVTHRMATWGAIHNLNSISKRRLEFNEDEEISFLFIVHSRLLPMFKSTTREHVDLKLFTDYRTMRGDFRAVNRIAVQYRAVLMLNCVHLSQWWIRVQITVTDILYKNDVMLVRVYFVRMRPNNVPTKVLMCN
jgi:hypothetical protein